MPEFHFGVLFILGIGAFGGILGASLFQRFRIPQVVGYIAIGVLIGQSGFRLVSLADVHALGPFNLFALGLIGFLVGGELHAASFRRYGRQFFTLLIFEGFGAFFFVGAATALVVARFTHSLPTAIASGLVFGAIASATDPASTISVLWEYRARGAVTMALIAVVVLDDALAMTLYGVGTSLAEILTGGAVSLSATAYTVLVHLLGAVALGAFLGFLVKSILRFMYDREKSLAIALGAILLAIGVARAFHLDVILASMTLGVVLTNIAPRRSKEMFDIVKSFSNPIYVIFFVLVGARLVVGEMPPWLWGLIVIYVIACIAGKTTGAFIGAKVSGAPRAVRRYCGLGLYAQGGVAVGLSIMASQHLAGINVTEELSLGDMIIFSITATTLIVQLIGPPMTKLAIRLAGEIDRNVTEDDIIGQWKVKDAMDREAIVVRENEPLSRVFETFSEHENNSYPVVDRNGNIVGIVSLEALKETLASQDTWEWLVAGDVMLSVSERVYPSTPLREALDLMSQLNFERLPVVRGPHDNRAVGILDSRRARWMVGEEVIRRQRQAPDPEEAATVPVAPPTLPA